jgi:hypothetical protein
VIIFWILTLFVGSSGAFRAPDDLPAQSEQLVGDVAVAGSA